MSRAAGVRAASILATALAWELTATLVASPLLPPVSRVVGALADLIVSGRIFTGLLPSLLTLIVGFSLAVAAGVIVGGVMGASPRVERVLEPFLHAGLATPMLIIVPVLLALTGPSRWTQIATVFLYAVFVITSHVLAGMHAASPAALEMARSFGATRWQTLRLVVLPGARPMLLSGMRVAVALAVKGMVNGEMLTASVGIGALVRTYGGRFQADSVLALLIVIVSITFSASAMLQAAERHVLGEGGVR